MLQRLDPILLSQPRLSIICFLKKKNEADFNAIKDKTGLSVGNLSIQLNNLKKVGYIEVTKSFKGNYPLTVSKITEKGLAVFVKRWKMPKAPSHSVFGFSHILRSFLRVKQVE